VYFEHYRNADLYHKYQGMFVERNRYGDLCDD